MIGIAGIYLGTCLAQYAGTQAAPCQVNLTVDNANGVYASGCISQTSFSGVLFGRRADLRAPGWNAQPQGQTLTLNFYFDRWANQWTAEGSGYGIADRKWTYDCSFRQAD
jgi:hypothetical protein